MDYTYEQIEQMANDILLKHNISSIQGVDVVKLANEIGFIVGKTDLDDNEDGFVMVDPDGINKSSFTKIIGVNSNNSPKHQMFTIAHELGHYLFEKNDSIQIYAHREHKKDKAGEKYNYENKIDYFAACLLMPKDSFIKRFESLKAIYNSDSDGLIEELSNIFGVSSKSVIRRIEELKI